MIHIWVIPKNKLYTLVRMLMKERLNMADRSYSYWNGPEKRFEPALKIFTKAPHQGFTAIILTYDRFQSLYKTVQRFLFQKK